MHEQVIVELSVSKEELHNKFVKEAFDGVGRGFTKHMLKKEELGRMKAKVVDLLHQVKEQEVVITTLEMEVKELHEFLCVRVKFVLHDIPSLVLEPLLVDDKHLQRPDINDKDVLEEQDGGKQKSNMLSRVKHEARKRVKMVVMKTPWTTYS